MKETFQKLFCPFLCFLFLSLSRPAILFLYLIHFSLFFSFLISDFIFPKFIFFSQKYTFFGKVD